jgi:hypothetical protein
VPAQKSEHEHDVDRLRETLLLSSCDPLYLPPRFPRVQVWLILLFYSTFRTLSLLLATSPGARLGAILFSGRVCDASFRFPLCTSSHSCLILPGLLSPLLEACWGTHSMITALCHRQELMIGARSLNAASLHSRFVV